MTGILSILQASPVVPVLVLSSEQKSLKLAEVMLKHDINIMEITLRTPEAMAISKSIKQHFPEMLVGVGTVTTPELLVSSDQAGLDFIVSPGVSPALLSAFNQVDTPILPGAATPSEVMTLASHGYMYQKFFPAESAGGVSMLKSLAGPLADINFCPTGGIGLANIGDYLALPNVLTAGCSWVAPGDLIEAEDWQEISERLKQVLAAAQI